MEFVGLALAIPPLLSGFLKIISYAEDFQTRFHAAPDAMASIIAQCSTMHIAMKRLQSLNFSHAEPSQHEREKLLQNIEIMITGCSRILARLEEVLVPLKVVEATSEKPSTLMGHKARMIFMRQEDKIKELLAQLATYHSSILIILSTAQMQSMEAMHNHLDRQSTTLEELFDQTQEPAANSHRSISALDNDSLNLSSIASDELSTTAIHFDRVSRQSSRASFDFDPIIAGSRIYQRVFSTVVSTKPEHRRSHQRNPSLKKPKNPSDRSKDLIIQVEESIDVEFSGPAKVLDKFSVPNPTRKVKFMRPIDLRRPFMLQPAGISFARAQGPSSKASSKLPTLELVVTGCGSDKKLLVDSLSRLQCKDVAPTVPFSNHFFCIINGRATFLHIVETPLDDDHYLVRELFLKSAQCFMLVYNVSSRLSFEKLISYRTQLLAAKGLYSRTGVVIGFPMILVANVTERKQRQVSEAEGREMAGMYGCLYIETSSESGVNIEEAFSHMIRIVHEPNNRTKRNNASGRTRWARVM